MKILLIGDYYSSNLGDGVICQTVEALFRSNFKEIQTIDILDISGRQDFAENRTHFYNKNRLKKEIKGLLPSVINETISYQRTSLPNYEINDHYDAAIYAGGQLLMPYFLKQMIMINQLLKKKNIKIIYNAVGYGKFYSKALVKKLSTIIDDCSVQHLSIRDGERMLDRTLVKKQVHTVCDNAVWASEIYDTKKVENSQIIGLGIMYIENKRQTLISFWRDTLLLLDKKGTNWKFFVNGSIEDYLFAKEILALHGCTNIEEYLCPRPETPKELIEVISSFEKIISFRLHSHIISYSLEIPSISIVWDDKVRKFFEKIDHPQRCYDYHNYDSNLLLNDLDAIKFTEADRQVKEKLKKEVLENLQTIVTLCRTKKTGSD
jgi:polysaccharide pyruvyl transferase WcaK-like protein